MVFLCIRMIVIVYEDHTSAQKQRWRRAWVFSSANYVFAERGVQRLPRTPKKKVFQNVKEHKIVYTNTIICQNDGWGIRTPMGFLHPVGFQNRCLNQFEPSRHKVKVAKREGFEPPGPLSRNHQFSELALLPTQAPLQIAYVYKLYDVLLILFEHLGTHEQHYFYVIRVFQL